MTKTSLDVATRSLQIIGVVAISETPDAGDLQFAQTAAQGALDELTGAQGLTIAWTIETVPDDLFLAFSDLVAAEIAGVYERPAPSRSRAITRLRAEIITNNIPDSRDTDNDGSVSTAEEEAAKQAAYF